MMRNLSVLFVTFLFLFGLTFNASTAQISFRDVYGNELPTPTWPPPDSIYEHNTITVWFNHNVINTDYLCDYWNYINSPPTIDKRKEEILSGTNIGCFPVSNDIILDTALVQLLQNLGAYRMCQYSNFSPCVDTITYKINGDSFPTPEFWNCYYISISDSLVNLDSSWVSQIIAMLLSLYGGNLIDYAELNTYFNLDALPPNDQYWNAELNYYNNLYGEDLLTAWDYTYGTSNVKVAIIDDGINYTHNDFGNGFGNGYVVSDGAEFHKDNSMVKPPTDGGGHGTPCAGLVGAITNNNFCIAGAAGGSDGQGGVRLFDIKVEKTPDGMYFYTNCLVNGLLYAAAKTSGDPSGDRGLGADIISNSYGGDYNETQRRAFDYAFRRGVTLVCSKGDEGGNTIHYPADFEYNKVIAVSSYGIFREGGNQFGNWIPSLSPAGLSNYGYGTDLLAQGDNSNEHVLRNATTEDGGGVRYFSFTSAATPQVAGTAALMLSNFKANPNPDFDGLSNEDIQGILNISAMDCNYYYTQSFKDTNGYDARTGYGILKIGQSLINMQSPYSLKYYSTTGGQITDQKQIDKFIVQTPTAGSGNTVLPPSKNGVYDYYAIMYTVRKEVSLNNEWNLSRSWGRSGDGTIGWSGQQPTDPDGNSVNYQTGYCRVVGEGMPNDLNFNFNNIRDISYRNDRITLETYCYDVYNKADNNRNMGRFPESYENIVFRYSIWGIKNPTSVNNDDNQKLNNSIYDIRCETSKLLGQDVAIINFKMSNLEKFKIIIYDNLGNPVNLIDRGVWSSSEEQKITINIDNQPSGVYFVFIRSDNGFGIGKFLLIK